MLEINDLVGKIICDDCINILKQIPDKSIDLILCDPPYGIGESNERNATRDCIAKTTDFGHYSWDREKLPDETIREMVRVSHNQVIFGGIYYGSVLGDTSCYIVWDKDNGQTDFADCELAWASFNRAVRKVKFKWQGMLRIARERLKAVDTGVPVKEARKGQQPLFS